MGPDAAPVNFPSIDKVKGPGGAAKLIETRRKLGQEYGFLEETIGPIADEVRAGVSAGSDWIAGRVSGNPAPIAGLYDDHLRMARADQEAYRAEHPTASLAANVLGAGAIGGPTAATGIGNATVQAAKQGAAWGGGYGFLDGEGVTGRLENAAWGSAVGLGVGMTIPLVAGVVKRVAAGIRNLVGLKGPAATRRAEEMVAEALQRDGVDLAAISQGGKPLTVADLGPNTRDLMGAASRTGGKGKAILEEFLEARTLGQYGRVSDDLAGGTGMRGQDFSRRAGDVAERRAATAATGYRNAYAQPAPTLSENAQAILQTPDGRSAVSTATRMMNNRRRPITDADGNYTVEMLDQIQRAMRDRANRASGQRSGEMAGNVNNLRGELIDELPDELRTVMAGYRSESELIDAMNAGRAFLRGDAENLATSIANMTPQEADMFRLGVARELRSKMGSKLDSGDVTGMFQNPQMRERLAAIFPSKRLFQEFIENTATERSMQYTRNSILKGSQTQPRAVADAEFNADALGEAALDMATGGGSTSLVRSVMDAGARGKDRLLTGVNARVGEEVAKIGVNTNISAVRHAIMGGQGTALARFQTGPGVVPASRGAAVAFSGAMSGPPAATTGWTIIKPENQ